MQTVQEKQKVDDDREYWAKVKNGICPECGSRRLIHEGGCMTCPDCGWSACS
jgi:DNA-directed RNA polymerase subunit RPC12/RpoP